MFCSTCGNQTTEVANFCKQCGARTEKAEELAVTGTALSLPQSLSISVAVIGGIGMFGLIILIANLMRKDVIQAAIVLLIFVLCLTLFGIIALLLRSIRILSQSNTAPYIKPSIAKREQIKLPPITGKFGLPEQPASITERTTHTLDEVLIPRN